MINFLAKQSKRLFSTGGIGVKYCEILRYKVFTVSKSMRYVLS